MRMGVAQCDSTRYPNTRLPTMAPSLADTRVTAIAVDLEEIVMLIDNFRTLTYVELYRRLVGNNSMPRQSRLLKPMVATAPNTQLSARFIPALSTR